MSLAFRAGRQPIEIVRNDGPLRISTAGPGLRGLPGPAGAGDVLGPASSVNGFIAVFDGSDGKHLKLGKNLPYSDIVGTIDVQTLRNKTLIEPGLSSPGMTGEPTAPTAPPGTNSTQVATTAFVQAAFGSNDAMIFKGTLDCSGSPNYPAADRGWTWRVSVAGRIGGGAGVNVEVGDVLTCLTDGTAAGTQATVGAAWTITQANIDGAVVGPASAVNGRLAVFSAANGKTIADGGATMSVLRTVEVSIYEPAGIQPGVYPDMVVDFPVTLSACRIEPRDSSPVSLGAVDVWLLVNGEAAWGPVRCYHGTDYGYANLSVALAAGDKVALAVTWSAGVLYELAAKFWGV